MKIEAFIANLQAIADKHQGIDVRVFEPSDPHGPRGWREPYAEIEDGQLQISNQEGFGGGLILISPPDREPA